MDITELFCKVDDFCQQYAWLWQREIQMMLASPQQKSKKTRRRLPRLSTSECCTILIAFHQSSYRNFKHFYTRHVLFRWRRHFPDLVSYNRFVELKSRCLFPLSYFLKAHFGRCSGLSFLDSTSLKVCHNRRIHSHRVFDGVAKRGKTSVGWFFGFKLHIVLNERGELLNFTLTEGNIDDREPVDKLTLKLFGQIFADKGYISQPLFEKLFSRGLKLITKLRKNMKNKLMSEFEKLMLRKRAVIESVYDQLKNISQIEHSRHRSIANFLINLVSGLIAYQFQPKKPGIEVEILSQVPEYIVF